MTSRSLYGFLIRLHPTCFRNRYEDQMLWIFDESVESRGAGPLLFDGFISLLRQWVLRSGYWRHAQPTFALDGATALSAQLRKTAETLHRRAWRLNFLWIACGLADYWIAPMSSHWSPIVTAVFISAFMVCRNNSLGRRRPEQGLLSIRSWPDAGTLHRQQLEGKRDGLRVWNGRNAKKDINLFGGGVLILLVVLHLAIIARLNFRPYLEIDRQRLWESSVGVVLLTLAWFFIRRLNERAARAIQSELDALKGSSEAEA